MSEQSYEASGKLLELAAKIRRKIGLWIIGEQFVTVTPSKWKAMTTEGFMALPDDAIGRMFRGVYGRIVEDTDKRAKRDGFYFTGAMNSTAILWLASQMERLNGEEASYSVNGSLDGGKTQGSWAVYVCRGNLDIPDGVTTEDQPDGRITNLTISTQNPGYARWAKDRAGAHTLSGDQ
jgi:hypothetical protein